MNSIIAGGLIAVGVIANLQVGGIMGVILLSCSLLMIIMQNYDICASGIYNRVKPLKLAAMLLGNAYGMIITICALSLTPLGITLVPAATAIITSKVSAGLLANTILGIGCGICLYLAVDSWIKSRNWIGVMLSIGMFSICGFGYWAVDLCYAVLGNVSLQSWLSVLATGIGNIFSCMLLGYRKNLSV